MRLQTYGIEVIDKTQFDGLMHEWSRPGGCKEITVACQAALKKRDGNITAFREDDEAVKLCSEADLCSVSVLIPYAESGRAGLYDIAHPLADPFPPPVVGKCSCSRGTRQVRPSSRTRARKR